MDIQNTKLAESIFGLNKVNNTSNLYFDQNTEYICFDRKIIDKIICINFSSRSGSVYLCDLLNKNTEYDNKIGEFFNPGQLKTFNKRFDTNNYLTTVENIIKKFSSHGYFGLKASTRPLVFMLLSNFYNIHEKAFRFVFLERKNKLDQSISINKARLTKVYHIKKNKTKNIELQKPINKKIIDLFDYDKLKKSIITINHINKNINKFYSALGIKAFHIYYEDFVNPKSNSLLELINYLNLKHENTIDLSSNYIRTRDNTNQVWKEKFLSNYSLDSEFIDWCNINSIIIN